MKIFEYGIEDVAVPLVGGLHHATTTRRLSEPPPLLIVPVKHRSRSALRPLSAALYSWALQCEHGSLRTRQISFPHRLWFLNTIEFSVGGRISLIKHFGLSHHFGDVYAGNAMN
jgi:hypothetical protein